MVERKLHRRIYGIMFLCLGVILLLILNPLLSTTIVSNKVDISRSEVNNLICTFEKVPFSVEDVLCEATGRMVTRLDIILGIGLPLNYYTYNTSEEDFIDIGRLYFDQGELLAFYSEELENETRYIIDFGKITDLYIHGYSDAKIPLVKIEKIHKTNWFDDFVSYNSVQISMLISFGLVITCSLFCLPFIEYVINTEIERKQEKEKKSKESNE